MTRPDLIPLLEGAVAELKKTQGVLKAAGIKADLMRPPQGSGG